VDGTGGWDRLFLLKLELLQVLLRSGGMGLSVLALVLALLRYSQKLRDLSRGDGVVANELEEVTGVATEILPS
jgi:DNA repair protein RadC